MIPISRSKPTLAESVSAVERQNAELRDLIDDLLTVVEYRVGGDDVMVLIMVRQFRERYEKIKGVVDIV